LRASRVFRLLFKIFILLLTTSITIVAFLGGYSAILILSNPDSIGVDTDNADFNFQINNATNEIEDFSFTLPFNITNSGFFDLENLALSISLDFNYSHVDDPAPGVNTTRQVEVFDLTQNFGTIHKGTTRNFNFTGDMSNFNIAVLPNFTTEVDWYRGPPAIEIYADMIISLDYTIGLHSLTIAVLNLELEGIS